MTAVDTNVVVRLLTGDDPRQAAAARLLFASKPVWLAKTVLLETAWVLRSLDGLSDSAVYSSFTKLLGLPNVYVEDSAAVSAALTLAAQGVEFDDALHLMSRSPGSTFVTFDKAIVQRARRAGIADVSSLP